MKTTITGASGFVGQNLSRYLEENGVEVDRLSLRNPAWELAETDAVIHLAGKAHDTKNTSEESEYFKINTDLTNKLFDGFLKSNAKDFIYFSSVKAAADTVDGILDETCKSDPQTAYGKSKLQAEEHLLKQNLPEGKRLFIIRPCMIHGPGNKGNLNLLYKVVEKGIPWPLAAFENKRSFLSIDNLNFLIEKMLISELPSGIYNFADDNPVSTNRLVTLIAEASGKKPKLYKISVKSVMSMAKLGDKLKLPLNSERLKKLTESYVVSNQKIKTALKIENLPLSAEEGLIKTIKSFKSKR
ncbi:NAD-dependent epimerase/dehydratase family protein [Chryseobacterium taklimakanense]|uniref:NAD-dependent epimerase/dehydratase family protein n=1 Tax=Chryseobacterium taklimakanense TaxID=536441 RepID=UPI000F5E0227|nr:NAD-dependent epimerase/dehydratase family protein [Chryseobacterium taklimakanense]AZI23387.1 NAD-dependent epimerase/dehydratase family protein [Chryseobacterium taklimakanense]